MDEFKIAIIVAILVSFATLGAIIYISQDAINNAKLPDVERGLVSSKAPVSDNQSVNFLIYLSSGQKKLYILNNSTFYNSIIVNQSYVFYCRVDFNNKMTIIDRAELISPTNSTS